MFLFDGYLIKHPKIKKIALIINNLLFDGYLTERKKNGLS